MQRSYIHIIYAKGRIFLLAVLSFLVILTALYQITLIFKKTFSPQTASPESLISPLPVQPTAKPFSQEEEEKIIAEVKNLSLEEVHQELEQKASEELKTLINQGLIPEETLRELLVVLRGAKK